MSWDQPSRYHQQAKQYRKENPLRTQFTESAGDKARNHLGES